MALLGIKYMVRVVQGRLGRKRDGAAAQREPGRGHGGRRHSQVPAVGLEASDLRRRFSRLTTGIAQPAQVRGVQAEADALRFTSSATRRRTIRIAPADEERSPKPSIRITPTQLVDAATALANWASVHIGGCDGCLLMARP